MIGGRLPLTTNTAVDTCAAGPGDAGAAQRTSVTAPTSRLELAAARRRLRRGVIGAVWAPAVVAALLVLLYLLDGRHL